MDVARGVLGDAEKISRTLLSVRGLLNKFDLRLFNFQSLTLESNLFFVKPQFRVNRLNVSEVIVFCPDRNVVFYSKDRMFIF